MEKLAERVGLFDLWGVFFPGAFSFAEILCIFGTYKNSALTLSLKYIPSDLSRWLVFILGAFFLGIILQEIGRFIRKIVRLKNATDGLLLSSEKVFSQTEIDKIKSYYSKMNLEDLDSKSIFHVINSKAIKNGIADKYVKLSVLQSTSLSLASTRLLGIFGWGGLFVCSLIQGLYDKAILYFVGVILCVLLMILFLKRSERFNRYWVRNIVFAIINSMSEELETNA